MAKQIVYTAPSNSSDASFRAWGSALMAALETLGVTKTADTGQIDWATVAKPTGFNTYMGYEIRQFTDALQATAPVIIKFEFGTGQNGPSIRFQVAESTDGAGTLTGFTSSSAILSGTSGGSATLYPCYLSSDGGRLNCHLWAGLGTTLFIVISIERLRDSAGDVIAGTHIILKGYSGYTQQTLPSGAAAYPSTALTGPMCSWPPSGVTTFAQNLGLFPIYPNLGYAGNPDLGILVYSPDELSGYGYFMTVNTYGVDHDYVVTGASGLTTINGASSIKVGYLVRYE